MRFHPIAAAAIMLPAFFASVAPAEAGISINALTANAPGAREATAFHGARVIAVEFAPIAR